MYVRHYRFYGKSLNSLFYFSLFDLRTNFSRFLQFSQFSQFLTSVSAFSLFSGKLIVCRKTACKRNIFSLKLNGKLWIFSRESSISSFNLSKNTTPDLTVKLKARKSKRPKMKSTSSSSSDSTSGCSNNGRVLLKRRYSVPEIIMRK